MRISDWSSDVCSSDRRREGRGSKHGNKHCDRRPSNAHGVTVPQANGIAENATASVPDCEAISAAIPCLMCTRTDRRSLFVTPNPMKITMPDVSGSLVTTQMRDALAHHHQPYHVVT